MVGREKEDHSWFKTEDYTCVTGSRLGIWKRILCSFRGTKYPHMSHAQSF
jgi:hypothetical protein